jgi:phosphatidylinositol alpha 1,6-mannosyltransferase
MMEDPFVTIARSLREHGRREPPRGVSAYVALGDSFTAGTGSPEGLGWADRIAASLRRRNSAFVYRNLAEDGATSAAVLGQVDQALQLEPDLVTVICGANDVLRTTRPDESAYARRLTRI